jgi:hypothetical protein
MLSGFLPFEAVGIPALFRKIKQRQYKCPDYLSREAVDMIDRMLTLDPEKRASLSELRNHPWMLMEYTDLAEQIEAQPPVTPEMVAAARAQCMDVGEEQSQAHAAANAQAQAAQQRNKFSHHSKSNSQPGTLCNGASAGKSLTLPSQSSDSLPSGSASSSPTPDDGDGKDGSSSAEREGAGSASAAAAALRPREHRPSVSMGGASAFSATAGAKGVAPGAKGFRDLRNGAQPTDRYSPNSFAVGSTAANAAAAAASKARTLSIFDKLSVRTNDSAPAGAVGNAVPPLPANSRYPRFSPNPGGDEGGRVRFPPIGSPSEPLSAGVGVGKQAGAGGRIATSRERARRASEFVSGGGMPSYMQPTENAQNHLLANEREEREKADEHVRRHRASSMASPPPMGALGKRVERAGLASAAIGEVDFYSHHAGGGTGAAAAAAATASPGLRGLSGTAKTPRLRELAAAGNVPAYMLDTNSSRQRGGSKVTEL